MQARKYAPQLDLDEDDLRLIVAWFLKTYARQPRTVAEAVGAFAFNAVTILLMLEAEDRDGRR